MERFGQRYPNVDVGDEEGFYGVLADEWDRMDRSDAAQRELGELLANDPRSAGFLMVMRKGGNPMEYLIEQYGDDFREIDIRIVDERTQAAVWNVTWKENVLSYSCLMIPVESHRYFDLIVCEAGLQVFPYKFLWMPDQQDANARVAEARQEGEVVGRNANIELNKRKRTKSSEMPSDISQSGRGGESGRREDPLLSRLDKIVGRRKSVWDD